MAGKIFINYRREDSRDAAARVHGALVPAFGVSALFMDVDNLLAGQRFDKELELALAECDVFLAVIGPSWLRLLEQREDSGERDYVREEIAGALKRQILVIPVLVNGAQLPRGQDLPDDISDLVKHQKHDLRHEHFRRDMAPLIDAIQVQRGPIVNVRPWRLLGVAGSAVGAAAVAGFLVWQSAGVINIPPVPSGPTQQIEVPKPHTSAADEATRQRAKAEEEAAAAKRKADEQALADAKRKADEQTLVDAKLKAEEDPKRAEAETTKDADERKRLTEQAAAEAETKRLADEKLKADATANAQARADAAIAKQKLEELVQANKAAAAKSGTTAQAKKSKTTTATPDKQSGFTSSDLNQTNCDGSIRRSVVACGAYQNHHPNDPAYEQKCALTSQFAYKCEEAGFRDSGKRY